MRAMSLSWLTQARRRPFFSQGYHPLREKFLDKKRVALRGRDRPAGRSTSEVDATTTWRKLSKTGAGAPDSTARPRRGSVGPGVRLRKNAKLITGEQVTEGRKLSWSLVRLAGKSGLSDTTVKKFERGEAALRS
jgi:hypothetical protein